MGPIDANTASKFVNGNQGPNSALVYARVAIDEQPVKACNERQTSIALPREPEVLYARTC